MKLVRHPKVVMRLQRRIEDYDRTLKEEVPPNKWKAFTKPGSNKKSGCYMHPYKLTPK